ncbi:zinc chelation protein SecC [Colwellia sp. 39_35_sub15_T18]|nr:zinc chelation protein SecC [Colwellia sp. 39_35_sub15_T18]
MSDKLFFKGRQDARQNHIKYGYKTNTNNKPGSKKYPLSLVVTTEARKLEIETLVADANLFAEVSIDNSDGAVESIAELTLLLNKHDTITVDKVPGRNDPCICGSGNKYKKCCG